MSHWRGASKNISSQTGRLCSESTALRWACWKCSREACRTVFCHDTVQSVHSLPHADGNLQWSGVHSCFLDFSSLISTERLPPARPRAGMCSLYICTHALKSTPAALHTGVALYRQDVEIELGCDQGRLCIWFTVDSVEKADNLILCAQPLIYTVKVTTLPHAYTSRVM
jgi:hypothetical protein